MKVQKKRTIGWKITRAEIEHTEENKRKSLYSTQPVKDGSHSLLIFSSVHPDLKNGPDRGYKFSTKITGR